MLTLLSVDALTERLTILEKLSEFLSGGSMRQTLRRIEQKPRTDEIGRAASEILAAGVSFSSWLPGYFPFFERKVREGCRFRFLVLDPDCDARDTWNELNKIPVERSEIEKTLKGIGWLQGIANEGTVEVRVTNCFLPYAMCLFDPLKMTGIALVEFYLYQATMNERPHVLLHKAEDEYWFNTFIVQFERAWKDAKVITPQSTSKPSQRELRHEDSIPES